MVRTFRFLVDMQLKVGVKWNYLDVFDALSEKGRVEGSYGRDKVSDHVGIALVEDLTTNEDVVDFGLRVERLAMAHQPLPSQTDVAVRGRHDEGDVVVGEGLKDLWVHIVDLHVVDGCPRLQEVRRHRVCRS